jgi:hypothetical protein
MCREWERSMSVWCGTRPGTRAGCRKRQSGRSLPSRVGPAVYSVPVWAALVRRKEYGSCVSKSDQYRRLARACLELARRAEDQQVRASLRHMAHVWFRLAEERVARLTKDNRLRANAFYPPPQPPFANLQPFLPRSCGGHLSRPA